MDTYVKNEGEYYNISECFGLFVCANECGDLADFTIEDSKGGCKHLCAECREKGGWM